MPWCRWAHPSLIPLSPLSLIPLSLSSLSHPSLSSLSLSHPSLIPLSHPSLSLSHPSLIPLIPLSSLSSLSLIPPSHPSLSSLSLIPLPSMNQSDARNLLFRFFTMSRQWSQYQIWALIAAANCMVIVIYFVIWANVV